MDGQSLCARAGVVGSLQGSVSMKLPQREGFRTGSSHSDWSLPR